MKKESIIAISALICHGAFAAIPLATNSWHVAFWPLTDRAVGDAFTSSHPADGQIESFAKASLPTAIRANFETDKRALGCRVYGDGACTVSDDVPSLYLYADAAARLPMAGPGDYLSLSATPTNAVWGKGQPSVWINGMGAEFAKEGRTEWTFEYFVKCVSFTPNTPILFFDINKYTTADGKEISARVELSWGRKVSLYSQDANIGYTWKNNNSAVTLEEDPSTDGRWHHVALVCAQETDADTGKARGTLTLYLDHQKGASTEVGGDGKVRFALPYNANLEFRILTGYGECLLAAPRFSDRALDASELMCAADEPIRSDAECVAYWPLDDQPAGIVFSAKGADFQSVGDRYTNQVTSTYAVNGRKVEIYGASVAVDGGEHAVAEAISDVPAKYIYPNLAAVAPLREPNTALHLYEASTETGLKTSTLNISYLSQTLNADLETWTLEWFEKPLSGRNYMYVDLYNDNGGESSRVVVESLSSDAKRPDACAYFATQTNGVTMASTNIVFAGDENLADGKWHHRALVLSKVDGEDRLALYCDYVRVGGPLPVKRNKEGNVCHICRFGQGTGRAVYSSIRVSKGALAPQEFMYASDREGGVLADSSWLWTLDGKVGETVASVPATRITLPADADQWLFATPEHGLAASVVGDGAAAYAAPVFLGRRLFGETDGGRNKSAAALDGAFVSADLTAAPLARLGLAFTVEVCVSADAPASGSATVVGSETAAGDCAWRVSLDSTGALTLEVALADGRIVSRPIWAADAGFVGMPRQVAVACDVLTRRVTVYVDRVLALALDATALDMPLSVGEALRVGGGCGGATLTGRIDEIRVCRDVLEPEAFERFFQRGFGIVIQ